MDAHEDARLSDEALDRAIAAAFDVEPSPELRARIRARVATERIHTGWWRSPALATGASLAVAAIALVAGWTLWDRSTVPDDPPLVAAGTATDSTQAETVTTATPEPPAAHVDDAPLVRVESAGALPEHRRATAIANGLEVVVSPADLAALGQLVAVLAAGQVKAVDIPELGVEPAPLPALEEIVLEPIQLSPIGLDGE